MNFFSYLKTGAPKTLIGLSNETGNREVYVQRDETINASTLYVIEDVRICVSYLCRHS